MFGSRFLAGATSASIRAAEARRVIAPALRVSAQRIQSRQVHNRLPPPYPVEEGLGDFLPPQALKVVAEEYQQGLLERLNEEVAGTHLRSLSVLQTVIQASKDPSQVVIYNYASEALNNSFFLNSLRPLPPGKTSHEDAILPDLGQAINADFGSLEQLKSTFSAAVNGMRSQGYVWLLADKTGHLAVYPTFGNGTLLVRSSDFLPTRANAKYSVSVVGEEAQSSSTSSNYRVRNTPPATSSPASGASHPPPPLNPHSQTRSYMPAPEFKTAPMPGASTTDVATVGDVLYPLFCVSVHEHAWMSAGYGVWGKEEWIKKFWSVVDWEQASNHFLQYIAKRSPRSLRR